MAHIKRVDFNTVGRNEGCLCDNCGQYIRNIWTVEFVEGESLHFGIDCYRKHIMGRLSDYGKKEMRRIMRDIEFWEKKASDYRSGKMTTENDQSYWYFHYKTMSYEEYVEWMLNELIPCRIEKANKELDKFKKIDFKFEKEV